MPVLLLKNFFGSVPVELEEATFMEVASLPQIVWRIVIRVSRAGIAIESRISAMPGQCDQTLAER